VFSFEAFASRLYVGIPWTLYALSSDSRTNIRTRALPCLTSKMSHDRSWRAACLISITNPLLHFYLHFIARGVTAVGVGSGALLGHTARPTEIREYPRFARPVTADLRRLRGRDARIRHIEEARNRNMPVANSTLRTRLIHPPKSSRKPSAREEIPLFVCRSSARTPQVTACEPAFI
jgi:hypothetical protein